MSISFSALSNFFFEIITLKHCAPNAQTAATLTNFQEYFCVAVCYQNGRQKKYSLFAFMAIQSTAAPKVSVLLSARATTPGTL
jgi:hypothetical protein